jgi:hypothetical protein
VQKQEYKIAAALIISYALDMVSFFGLEFPDYKHEFSADHNMKIAISKFYANVRERKL